MKIAYVNRYYYPFGGAENVMLAEMNFFTRLGYEVSIFAVQNENNFDSEYSKIFILKDLIEEKLENHQKLSFFDYLKFFLSNINNFQARDKFEMFIKEVKPDLIHVHCYSRYLTPLIFETAKKYKIPVITTEHSPKLICPVTILKKSGKEYCKRKYCIKGNNLYSLFFNCYYGKFLNTFSCFVEHTINKKRYVNNIDAMLVPSLYLIDLLLEAGISENKLFHIKNFVDLKKFKYLEKVGDYYLYFGRLSHEKGLLTLIKAFEQLPELSLKVVGKGPDEDVFKDYITNKNIKNIDFLGKKDGQELVEIIQDSKATILPSEWGENAPLSVLESMACGKPVIGANIGGIPEMIVDNIDGFLFESGNVNDLKQSILKITQKENSELINMGRNARRKVEENYTLEKHCKNVMQIYHSILEGEKNNYD